MPEHTIFFSGVHVVQSLVFCVVICWQLIVFSSFLPFCLYLYWIRCSSRKTVLYNGRERRPDIIGAGPLGWSRVPQGTLRMQLCLVDGSNVWRCPRRICSDIELSYYLYHCTCPSILTIVNHIQWRIRIQAIKTYFESTCEINNIFTAYRLAGSFAYFS
jgi:hypothetical protein